MSDRLEHLQKYQDKIFSNVYDSIEKFKDILDIDYKLISDSVIEHLLKTSVLNIQLMDNQSSLVYALETTGLKNFDGSKIPRRISVNQERFGKMNLQISNHVVTANSQTFKVCLGQQPNPNQLIIDTILSHYHQTFLTILDSLTCEKPVEIDWKNSDEQSSLIKFCNKLHVSRVRIGNNSLRGSSNHLIIDSSHLGLIYHYPKSQYIDIKNILTFSKPLEYIGKIDDNMKVYFRLFPNSNNLITFFKWPS